MFPTHSRNALSASAASDTHGSINSGAFARELGSEERQRLLGTQTADRLRDYIIDFSDLQTGDVIGAGATSSVHVGSYKGSAVAIKKFYAGPLRLSGAFLWL